MNTYRILSALNDCVAEGSLPASEPDSIVHAYDTIIGNISLLSVDGMQDT